MSTLELELELASVGITSHLAILNLSGTKERHSIVFSDRRWWNHTVVLSESLIDPISKLFDLQELEKYPNGPHSDILTGIVPVDICRDRLPARQ